VCALEEVDGVVVVFRQAGANSQDVGVEDDVLGVKAHLLDQDLERPTADAHLHPEQHGSWTQSVGVHTASAPQSRICDARCCMSRRCVLTLSRFAIGSCLVRGSGSLALLVKSHDDNRRAMALDDLCMVPAHEYALSTLRCFCIAVAHEVP